MLERDAFQDVCDIFTAIRSLLEVLINLFPFDDDDRIFFVVKELGDGITRQSVGLVFQAVHRDADPAHIGMPFPKEIDAGSHGKAIASLRLHALRRGAQDAELLRLLELEKGWSRERIGLLVSQTLGLKHGVASAADFARLKRVVLRLLEPESRSAETAPSGG